MLRINGTAITQRNEVENSIDICVVCISFVMKSYLRFKMTDILKEILLKTKCRMLCLSVHIPVKHVRVFEKWCASLKTCVLLPHIIWSNNRLQHNKENENLLFPFFFRFSFHICIPHTTRIFLQNMKN